MANQGYTIKFTGQFDTSQITKGIQDIKKQVTNANISDELKKQFEAAFNKLQVNIPALEKLTSKEEFNLKDIEALQKLLKEVTKDWENLNKVTDQIDLSKTFSAKDLEKINNLDKQIKQTQDNIQKARKELVDTFTKDPNINVTSKNVSDALTELFTVNPSEIDSKFKEIQEQFTQGIQQTQVELKNKLEHAKIVKTREDVIGYFFGDDSGVEFAGKSGPIVKQIQDITKAYREAAKAQDDAKMAEQIQKLNEVLTSTANFKFPEGYKLFGLPTQEDLTVLNSIGAKLGELKTLAETKEGFFTEEEARVLDLVKQKIDAEAQAALNAKKANDQLRGSTNEVGESVQGLSNKTEDVIEQQRKLQAQSEALNATFGGLIHRINSAISATAIFNKGMQITRNAIQSVKELDAAFTQIAIVSEQSGEQAWKLFNDFNKLAKQYSITTKDLTEGAKLFYQQGLSAADTMKMVEASTVSAALGEVTMTEAANTLTAAIQGYNESAAVAMDYTDKIAMVGAVSAADFNELSTAMEKTASSAYTAGIDFDHLLGYLGKMIEVTREAPANLGTAMKTIIARFEDMKKDPMAILEDGVSANKVEAALATIGIALRDTAGEFRPLQDVMDELGMKWDSLTRNQQAYIATVAAGSRQQSRFLALMNNYDRTLDLITESQNSAGAAAQQYATYQDSIAAAQARLTASWEKLYSKIVDNDIIKFAINGLTELLELLSHVPPSITAIGATIGALQLQDLLKQNGGLINIITNLIGGGEGKSFKEIGAKFINDIYTGLEDEAKKLDSRGGGWNVIGKGFHEIPDVLKNAKNSLIDFRIEGNKVEKVIGELGDKLKNSFRGLLNLALNPKALGITAVITAIGLLIFTINKLKNRANNAAKEIKKLNEEIATDKDTLKNNEDLLKKYDDLNKKINRSTEEQKDLNDIIKEMEETYDNAITWMDEYGNMHLSNRDSIAAVNAELRENIRLKEQEKRNKQKDFLDKTPPKQWTKENLTDSGFSSIEINRLLQARDNDKYLQAIEKARKVLNKGDEASAYNILKSSGFTEKYNLNFENMFTGEWTLKNGLSRMKHVFTDQVQEIIDSLEENSETVEEVTKEMLHNIDIDELFGQFNVDAKHTPIVSLLKNIIKELPIDDYEKLEEQFPDIIQKLLSITDNDELIEAFNLVKKLKENEGMTEEDVKNLGNLLGQDFIDGVKEGIENKKQEAKKTAADALNAIFGVDTFSEDDFKDTDMTEDYQQKLQDHADYVQKNNPKISEKYFLHYADPALTEVDEILNEALIKGLSFDEVMEKVVEAMQKYGSSIREIGEEYAEDGYEIIKDQVINKSFNDAQTAIQNLVAYSKENLQDIYNGESRESTKDETGNYEVGTYIDNDSGEAMVSALERANELQVKLDSAIITTEASYNKIFNEYQKILEKGENLTAEEEKRKKELEGQLRILGQQDKVLRQQQSNLQNAGWGITISLAEEYQGKLKTIKSIQDSINKKGFINPDEMKQIYQIMPEFAQAFERTSNDIYTIKAQSLENMKETVQKEYEFEVAVQRQLAVLEYQAAKAEYESLLNSAKQKNIVLENSYEDEVTTMDQEVTANESKDQAVIDAAEQAAVESGNIGAKSANNLVTLIRAALEQIGKDFKDFIDSGGEFHWDKLFDEIQNKLSAEDFTAVIGTEFDRDNFLKAIENLGDQEMYQALIDNAKKRMEAALAKIRAINSVDLEMIDSLEGKLAEAGNAGTDAINDMASALDELTQALENIGTIVDDLKESLKDVTIDIDPFTELFEEWEHEWDYFFNIKNFIGNKQRSRNLFSRVADAEWASPEDRLAMDDAIMGSYASEFAARREYANGLMADIVQKGTDMTEKYGQFGTFDPETMTWYQKDDQLVKLNEEQAQRVENINNLQKQQWEKNNELAAKEAELDILESEKDKYEDALSIINDTIDSLKEKEGIEADTSALEDEKKKLEDNLKATEDGIEAQKDSIKDLEEEIKKIDFDLETEQGIYDFWDNFVNGMDDDISSLQAEIEEYFDNIDAMYEDIEGKWEKYTKYLEATINTQQQLFDAIVENYQKEIDAKKKEYDELKRLDNEYLQSVKDNIAKEREAREDSKKQKSYQQSLQRAQLLQMDTSGAFRTELNELKNSIEQQREDLYDDLVDKQVEALEKEIEKRHELYDKEVAALEERLAYMQENASLLWEMVNEIVAQGSGAMMSTLEGTAEYMNSSELQREQLRNQWQYNTLASIKFTTDQWGKNQELMIKAMGEMAKTVYPNYKKEVEDNTEVLKKLNQSIEDYKNSIIQGKVDVDDAMSSLVSSLSTEFTNYMNGWAVATSTLTGNVTVYGTAVNDMISSLSTNIQTLDGWNSGLSTSGGKIIKTIETYDEELAKKYAEIYKDYEDERNKYQGELDSLIQEIQEEISSAIEDAAEAIRKAVDSLTAGNGSGGDSGNGSGSGNGGGGGNTPTNPEPNPGGGSGEDNTWRLRYWVDGKANYSNSGSKQDMLNLYSLLSQAELTGVKPSNTKGIDWELWKKRNGSDIGQFGFKQGGLANFTGLAWLDGTKSAPERVLSPHQTKLFESMVSSLERASNNSNINSTLGSSYNIGDINTSIQVAKLDNQTDINQLAKQVEDKIVKTIRNRVTISV